jgi:hypothetical protein
MSNNPTRGKIDNVLPIQKLFGHTQQSLGMQQNLAMSEEVVKVLCTVFTIDKNLVREGNYRLSGESRLTLRGLNEIVSPKFPAIISFAKSTKEIKEKILIGKLLTNPESVPIIKKFLERRQNLNSPCRPVIVAFTHVFSNSLVCVTDLPLAVADSMIHFGVNANYHVRDAAPAFIPITVGTLSRVALAIREQGLWQPCLTACATKD